MQLNMCVVDGAKLEEMFVDIKLKYNLQFNLSDEQRKVLLSLLSKKNTCAIMPTGSGKSALFALLPLILDHVCSIIKQSLF